MNELKMIAEVYQPLFDLMSKEYGLTLICSEMDEIIHAVEEVNERYNKVFNSCDVDGCEEQRSSGGAHWKETGYWCLCSKHHRMGSKGEPQPKMKESAITREASRGADGVLPSNTTNS